MVGTRRIRDVETLRRKCLQLQRFKELQCVWIAQEIQVQLALIFKAKVDLQPINITTIPIPFLQVAWFVVSANVTLTIPIQYANLMKGDNKLTCQSAAKPLLLNHTQTQIRPQSIQRNHVKITHDKHQFVVYFVHTNEMRIKFPVRQNRKRITYSYFAGINVRYCEGARHDSDISLCLSLDWIHIWVYRFDMHQHLASLV